MIFGLAPRRVERDCGTIVLTERCDRGTAAVVAWREKRRLWMENEILRQTAAHFAKDARSEVPAGP